MEQPDAEKKNLVSIRHLTIAFPAAATLQLAVNGLDMDLAAGQTVALFGPSGSGKSATAGALLGLLPAGARVGGSVRLEARELTTLTESQWRKIRGRRVAAVFQEPHASLNPVVSVGAQLDRLVGIHSGVSRRSRREQTRQLLRSVGLDPADQYGARFPHQLSGGQAQRALIAMALACKPELLIADEVTSALDAVTAVSIMQLLREQQQRMGFAMLLISHDVEMVRRFADVVIPIDRGVPGKPVSPGDLPREPSASSPAPDHTRPCLRVSGVGVSHRGAGTSRVAAVRGVSFDLAPGETLALVGESGCGKTSLARAILGLLRHDTGQLLLDGQPLPPGNPEGPERRQIQMVFQDPYTSLNPRMTVGATLTEAIACAPDAGGDEASLLSQVRLSQAFMNRYPHQLSGGERQRVSVARALAVKPRILVLDEPMSALDGQTRRQLLELLRLLQQQRGLAYLMISHDLAVVRAAAHRTAVMKNGELVETGPTEQLFVQPKHAYTRELLGVEFKG